MRMTFNPGSTEILIGVDLGDRRDPSAICVAEEEKREEDDQRHYLIRHLERLSIGTSYPDIARRIGDIDARILLRGVRRPKIFVNATGRGQPIVDHIKRASVRATLKTVYFNYGDRRTEENHVVNLGKAYLVSRLQLLLQSGRLHLPRTRIAEDLAEELLNYQIDIAPDANEHYGAFRVGRHDDLVTALGMAVQGGLRIHTARWYA